MAALRSTEPLRRELATTLPDRPFTITFWDGTELPATNGGGPALHVRSPAALAHALRAPGQLGIGRAYVSGELDVDAIDAVMDVVGSFRPPLGPPPLRRLERLLRALARQLDDVLVRVLLA